MLLLVVVKPPLWVFDLRFSSQLVPETPQVFIRCWEWAPDASRCGLHRKTADACALQRADGCMRAEVVSFAA